ncbi:hypothetical protein FDA33_10520 [Clostridium botulinum]|uniref:Uncharacterized protein n=1 Tax=Clostridium botulinum TaxID=1491 RepID=A0A0M1LD91_CLOBO|nr:hypothetical protein [Clostridium botulinum]ALT05305.1 bacterial heme peroxidase [Clostridium botulinum]KOR55613.1 hypothetical protein ADT22_15365 [Clostridium botulinum]MCS6112691.1 hypothetical protein [Clostridium botulinum]NFF89392.1 hypothetical protein [Clostridium botulinum]NFG11545.1 hypothetical protein [Clostridium botulinum]
MTTEKATIIAAVIAAIASIVSSAFTLHSIRVTKKGNEENIESNKEISNKVQEAENIRIEAQIDANITWNARVEWIQNVRRITAEFITACYKFIHSDAENQNEQNRNLELIQEKKSLLILYFGPDGTGENKAKDICDTMTNKAKNEMIVTLINKLFEQLKLYFSEKKAYDRSREELAQCSACENTEHERIYDCVKYQYEGVDINFTESDCKQLQEENQKKQKISMENIKALFDNINLLTEAMRIYLKIEWNCTKSRRS